METFTQKRVVEVANKPKKSITIKDVASRAGVSLATTSRVLSWSGYASEDARNKVHKAAKELGYRPHALARNLKLNRRDMIGLLITDIVNPFYSILASGVLASAWKLGYHVIVSATDENPKLESEYLEVLMEERAAGVIAVCTGQNLKCWQEAEELGIKIVLVDREIKNFNSADIILVDNAKGAYEAVTYLIELGHRRIGIINGPVTTTTGEQRLSGYIRALKDSNIPIDPSLQEIVTFKGESGHLAAERLLTLQDRPTAIFIANNVLGEAAMLVIQKYGLNIPDDLSIIIFDDVPWTSLTNPSITVVNQPTYQLGYLGMELLHQQLEAEKDNEPYLSQKRILNTNLVIRESTKSNLIKKKI